MNDENNRNQLNYGEPTPIEAKHSKTKNAIVQQNILTEPGLTESERIDVKVEPSVPNQPTALTELRPLAERNVIKVELAPTTAQNVAGSLAGRKNKPTVTATASTCSLNAKPFRAFAYVEEYQKRKDNRLKQVEREEREKRRCFAKPMPNFTAIHLKALMKQPAHPIDVISPETPEVLRRGLAMKEKFKQKVIDANE